MVSECFSRASGGDPDFAETLGTSKVFPRASGGGPATEAAKAFIRSVLPAPAGVIPTRQPADDPRCRLPRASGGDPRQVAHAAVEATSSPRERG